MWKEDITFEERDGSYKVTDENIHFLDYIVSGTEFDEAYPQINGTPIDYTVNGRYDALVMNLSLIHISNMVVIEGFRGGKSRVTVEKPLIVYKEQGVYTDCLLYTSWRYMIQHFVC